MKNKKVLLSLVFPLSITLFSCGKSSSKEKGVFYVRYIQEEIKNKPISDYYKIRFNVEDFINQGAKPTKEMADLALTFIANGYQEMTVDMKNAKYPIESCTDFETFYKEFGFQDVKVFKQTFEEEPNDGVSHIYAHLPFEYESKQYDLVLLTYRGSGDSDWASNFDVGADNPSYYEKTGEHPLWTNKNYHKGFEISANREYDSLNEYLSKLNQNSQQILFICAHSRGAAIANLLGKRLIDDGKDVHSYAFAVPNPTTYVEKEYETLYNFNNTSDPITHCPPESWGFKRYGKTYEGDIYQYVDEFNKFNHYELPSKAILGLDDMFALIADSREEIYEYKYMLKRMICESEEKAQQVADDLVSPFEGDLLPLKKFVTTRINFDETENGYEVTLWVAPGFITDFITLYLNLGSEFMNKIAPIFSYLLSFINAIDLKGKELNLIDLMGMYDKIFSVHLPQSYKVILDNCIDWSSL